MESRKNYYSKQAFENVGKVFGQAVNQISDANNTGRLYKGKPFLNSAENFNVHNRNEVNFYNNKNFYTAYKIATKTFSLAGKLLMASNPSYIAITSTEKVINTKNYISNKEAYQKNLANKTAGLGIYINGQGRDEYKDLKFGVKGTVGGNGCMGISIYNSLISLQDYESLPDINYKLALTDATLLGGKLGGNPTFIKPYLTSKLYNVDSYYFPDLTTVETAVKNGDTAILFYGYTNPVGAHYITIDYDKSNKEKPFKVYNEFNDSYDGNTYADLSWYIQDDNYPVSVYSIRK